MYDFLLSDNCNQSYMKKCPGSSEVYNSIEWGLRFCVLLWTRIWPRKLEIMVYRVLNRDILDTRHLLTPQSHVLWFVKPAHCQFPQLYFGTGRVASWRKTQRISFHFLLVLSVWQPVGASSLRRRNVGRGKKPSPIFGIWAAIPSTLHSAPLI